MNYAVIFTYSFDPEVPVYLFTDFDSAADFLRTSMMDELKIDVEEDGWNSVLEFSEDNGYAKITTYFNDHVDITEAYIGTVYQKCRKAPAFRHGDMQYIENQKNV